MAKFARRFNLTLWNFKHLFWVYVCQKQSDMQPRDWRKVLYWILLASNGANLCCTKVDAAWAKNSNLWGRKDLLTSRIPYDAVKNETFGHKAEEDDLIAPPEFASPALSELLSVKSQIVQSQKPPAPQTNPAPEPPSPQPSAQQPTPNSPPNNQQRNDPPPLEGQPTNFPQPSSTPVQPLLKIPETEYAQRLEKLRRRLHEKKSPQNESYSNGELGRLLVRERQQNSNGELGIIRARERPLEQPPLPPSAPPVVKSKPIGYLLANVGIFHTNNIFSSVVPIQDSLYYSGLTLATAPLRLGSSTYINGSIDGSLIRYINQSKYNYNQVRFNVSIYQQLSPQMYGEIGWSNQQLFYSKNSSSFSAGDRFLNENSVRLSLGRRDTLNSKLFLDSFYEFRWSFTDPPKGIDSRDRTINSLWLSLNYYLESSLQVGLDYQFGLSNFKVRSREDQYHRLFGHLTYGIGKNTNLSLQSGITLGSSTAPYIDFNGWFFTLNYNLQLGQF